MQPTKRGPGRPSKTPPPSAAPTSRDMSVPAFLDPSKDGMEGFEGIDPSTMSIPFLKIAQPQGAQTIKGKAEYIDGLEHGMFFNSVTKFVYGEEIEVIVLAFERLFLEWMPDRGGFVAAHSYENADRIATSREFGEWKHGENDLVETYTYFVLVVGHEAEGPCVLSLTSTNIPIAKAWNRQMTTTVMSNGIKARPYYLRFRLRTDFTEKGQFTWYKIRPEFAGYVDESQYAIVKPERAALPDRSVDYAKIEDRTGDAPTAPADAPEALVEDEDPFGMNGRR